MSLEDLRYVILSIFVTFLFHLKNLLQNIFLCSCIEPVLPAVGVLLVPETYVYLLNC
jgi:hypothetical protein